MHWSYIFRALTHRNVSDFPAPRMATASPSTSDEFQLEKFVSLAARLCDQCVAQGHIKGIHKLHKKCKAELKFLESVSTTDLLPFTHQGYPAKRALSAMLKHGG